MINLTMTQPEKNFDLTAEQKGHHESVKLLFEVYKHITTLSTGAIVILSTFLEKIFKTPKEPRLIVLSLIGFLAAILFSIWIMAYLAVEQEITRKSRRIDRILFKILYYLSPAAFMFGVLALAAFTVLNLSG